MMTRDESLSDDARIFRIRGVHSVTELPHWGTLSEWKRERQKIRKHLWLCTGLNEQTSRFRARGTVVRRFEHEGIIVENIRIETLPGLYVMGNLYRPKRTHGRLPVVLHPHGHAMNARTTVLDLYSVPDRGVNTAFQGMVGFAWSMIAYEDDAMQIPHRAYLSGKEKETCNLLGLSTFGLQINNGIKVIDYLTRRKDIDPNQVGCTGESGGATQTYYLAALDDRVKVAAPAVMLSGHFQGGCVCENAPRLHLEYSTMHYAGLIAPRPLFLTGCSGDWTHHMRERELVSMRELYKLYGREDAVDGFFQDEAHNYNRSSREYVYAWMNRWLAKGDPNRRRIPESSLPVPAREDLLVHDSPVPPVKGVIRSKQKLIRVWSKLHSKPEDVSDALDLLNLRMPPKKDILVKNRTPKRDSKGKVLGQNRITYGRFSDEGRLVARFVLPDTGHPTHLVVRSWKDESAWVRFTSRPSPALAKLVERGDGVIVPLLFGQSCDKEEKKFRDRVEDSYLYTSYNRTLHEHQVHDLLTTIRLAQVEMGIKSSDIRIVAEKSISPIALLAWSALCAQKEAGSYAGDFSGIDLEKISSWARRCYVPLILRLGGLAAIKKMCGRRAGLASGVSRRQSSLMPAGVRTRQKAMSLEALLQA